VTTKFTASDVAPMRVHLPSQLANWFTLSPFVWKADGPFRLLLRVVNRDENPEKKISRIHYGECPNGLDFHVEPEPVIAPGPDAADAGGCEDPTLAMDHQTLVVYYTGWNPIAREALLLHATGPDVHHLVKCGAVLPPSDRFRWSKEVEIVRAADGTWRLFFEYSDEGKSKIGVASAPRPMGPWSYGEPPFAAREGQWDDWHLSTGPIASLPGRGPVMFYNGATHEAHWRIGWVEFDPNYTRVLDRGDDFLLGPGPVHGDDTDIAFAASAVTEGDAIYLYYSVSDRVLTRATIRAAS